MKVNIFQEKPPCFEALICCTSSEVSDDDFPPCPNRDMIFHIEYGSQAEEDKFVEGFDQGAFQCPVCGRGGYIKEVYRHGYDKLPHEVIPEFKPVFLKNGERTKVGVDRYDNYELTFCKETSKFRLDNPDGESSEMGPDFSVNDLPDDVKEALIQAFEAELPDESNFNLAFTLQYCAEIMG